MDRRTLKIFGGYNTFCVAGYKNWYLLLFHCRYFDKSFLELFAEWSFVSRDFYHLWAWRPVWLCDLDHLNKLSSPPFHRGSTWNLASICPAVSKEKKLENVLSEWQWPWPLIFMYSFSYLHLPTLISKPMIVSEKSIVLPFSHTKA